MSEIKVTVEYHIEDIRNYNIEKISEIMYEIGAKNLQKLYGLLFGTMKQVSDLTGNVAKGELTVDKILELLEKISIDFDDEGRPRLPQFLCGPKLYEKVSQLKLTSEQQTRFSEIIDKKRKQHYAQRCYRRLSFID